MKNDWKFYTTHEGISFIRNAALDVKNYYRMKVFLKNYFKERCNTNSKRQASLLYSIVKSVSGEKNGKKNDTPFSCEISVDRRKIDISWSEDTGLSVAADTRDGNGIIRELFTVLKENDDNEFWSICI